MMGLLLGQSILCAHHVHVQALCGGFQTLNCKKVLPSKPASTGRGRTDAWWVYVKVLGININVYTGKLPIKYS